MLSFTGKEQKEDTTLNIDQIPHHLDVMSKYWQLFSPFNAQGERNHFYSQPISMRSLII
jgi:hypothetical protein